MKFYCVIKVISHENDIYEYCGAPCLGYEEAVDLVMNRFSGNEVHTSFIGNDTTILWGNDGEVNACYYIVGGKR